MSASEGMEQGDVRFEPRQNDDGLSWYVNRYERGPKFLYRDTVLDEATEAEAERFVDLSNQAWMLGRDVRLRAFRAGKAVQA